MPVEVVRRDVQDRGDARVMAIAIRELRLAYKLFHPYSEKRKVTMFGSARTLPTTALRSTTWVGTTSPGGSHLSPTESSSWSERRWTTTFPS